MSETGWTHIIGGRAHPGHGDSFQAVDPRTAAAFGPAFPEASEAEVSAAVAAAARAQEGLATHAERRSALLRSLAGHIDADAERILTVADRETALGQRRLRSELARTTNQLRLFAQVVDRGAYIDARVDHADASAQPPRPDVRRMLIVLGPVAVFGASNFPLAFGVVGGDTASALAAGCPVIAKSHPAHPSTAQVLAGHVVRALVDVALPVGSFALLHGRQTSVGEALVDHPGVTAVAFTGSHAGGRALFDRAARRDRPIPVFAEMGSLNPVLVGAGAASERPAAVAASLVDSMTGSMGQFCTKPGAWLIPSGPSGDALVEHAVACLAEVTADVLLTQGIRDHCARRTRESSTLPGVRELRRTPAADDGLGGDIVLLETEAAVFAEQPGLREEHFGPIAIVVRYDSEEQARLALAACSGSLTGTVIHDDADLESLDGAVSELRRRAGRIVYNGVPTGLAVGWATQHGGPYPATTDARFTSVGTASITRWLRPIAYQNAPSAALPPELRDANPLGIPQLVDGVPSDPSPADASPTVAPPGRGGDG